MKKIIFLLLVLGSLNVWSMDHFPQGNFHGKGHGLAKEGGDYKYQVEVKVTPVKIENTYHTENGLKKFVMDASFGKNGFFDVLMNGAKIGSGYCMSVWCHYSIKFGDNTLEETLTFYENHLYRLGQKSIDGKLVSWEEDLDRE